jgi:hypothetical protein
LKNKVVVEPEKSAQNLVQEVYIEMNYFYVASIIVFNKCIVESWNGRNLFIKKFENQFFSNSKKVD